MADDDDFGGFEEAQPVPVKSNITTNTSQSSLSEQKTPDWLLETFTKSTKFQTTPSSPSSSPSISYSSPNQPISTTTNQLQTRIENLEEQLKKAFNLIQNQQENYQNLQKQFEILRLTNIQLNKELEINLKNSNLKEIKQLNEENIKLFEQKLTRLNKDLLNTITLSNTQIEENFSCKLATLQQELIKHIESENETLEIRLNKIIKTQIDDQIHNKVKQLIETLLKEQKIDNDKFFKQQYTALSESFKEQIKSNIEQETLILKDIMNKKLEIIIKNYEIKHKNTNYLYSRQLTNLSSFLDNAKIQIDLMQNHIKKQNDITTKTNFNEIVNDLSLNLDSVEDETLLNM